MKIWKNILLIVTFACIFTQGRADAQNQLSYLEYDVHDGDTLYYDVIGASKIYARIPRQKGRDWRKYYRLVYNFGKVYPYAVAARKLVAKADSTFEADNFRRRDKEKYVNDLQKELFRAFEKPVRNMSITQGQLLMKLIDREVGKSSFNIIKEYKSGIAAGFWQGIAKLFGTDLKKPYDPYGDDSDVEDLVKKWEAGDFPAFYWALFGEYPKITEIPLNLM